MYYITFCSHSLVIRPLLSKVSHKELSLNNSTRKYNSVRKMNSYLFVAFFLIIAKCAAQEDLSQAEFLKEKLPGQWKEDQHKRKNLNNYLYEMGMYLIADTLF